MTGALCRGAQDYHPSQVGYFQGVGVKLVSIESSWYPVSWCARSPSQLRYTLAACALCYFLCPRNLGVWARAAGTCLCSLSF